MKSQITLTYGELRALFAPVIPHAGTDDMLPVLLMVQVTTEAGYVVAKATDRFTAAFRRVKPASEIEAPFSALVQATDAKRMLNLLRPNRGASDGTDVTLTLSGTGELGVAARSGDGFALGFSGIDVELLLGGGDYPDVLGLLPSAEDLKTSVAAAKFRVDFLSRFRAALDVCDTENRRIERGLQLHMPTKPGRPMWVTVGDDHDFIGAVMPRTGGAAGASDVVPSVIESWRPAVKRSAATS